MNHVDLTRRHIIAALQVKPHIFREWTENLEPFKSQPTQERVPRKFVRRDLLFFYIVKWLVTELQLPVAIIGRFSASLADCVAKPISTTSPGLLFVQIESGVVSFVRAPINESGITIDLAAHVRVCDAFFGIASEPEQRSLPFGLTDVPMRKGEVAV